MNRINVATRGIYNWRERLANPAKHWRRTCSAMEAAVSWELASRTPSGLPDPILQLMECQYGDPTLLLAVAEQQVSLPGGKSDSQNDVWALVKTSAGIVSLTVEAKAREPFGKHTLATWLIERESERSRNNRRERWAFLYSHLPVVSADVYARVPYQLLHRCASAVIEARRFGLKHAACIIQAFKTPDERFVQYAAFCNAMGLTAARGQIRTTLVGDIELAIGWADCPLATDAQIATVAS